MLRTDFLRGGPASDFGSAAFFFFSFFFLVADLSFGSADFRTIGVDLIDHGLREIGHELVRVGRRPGRILILEINRCRFAGFGRFLWLAKVEQDSIVISFMELGLGIAKVNLQVVAGRRVGGFRLSAGCAEPSKGWRRSNTRSPRKQYP